MTKSSSTGLQQKYQVPAKQKMTDFIIQFFRKHGLSLLWLGNGITGFVFGFSISFGLGLRTLASLAVGIVAAFGVIIANSLIGFVLVQTASLTLLTVITYAYFRVFPLASFQVEHVQSVYLLALLSSPLLSLFPKIRDGVGQLGFNHASQLVSVAMFAGLVQILRVSRPSDAPFAFSQMYSAEDNAGIVGILGASLQGAYGSHAHMFGEFFNGIYLASAGYISWFSTQSDLSLLAILTHWNLTTIFLAWAPIAAFVALTLSGKKLKPVSTIVVLSVMSLLLVLLMWPFSGIGHTSVITSGSFAMSFLALTMNKRLASSHPILYTFLSTSFGFIVGITWFPLMPFVAAVVGITLMVLLRQQFLKGNRKSAVAISVSLVLLVLSLLPSVWGLVSYSGTYLQMSGGSRSASDLLVLSWLAVAAVAILRQPSVVKSGTRVGSKIFTMSLMFLVASNTYLLIKGFIGNSGSLGYGATKYLLTSIAFSAPLLFLLALTGKKKHTWLSTATLGLISIFAVLIVQPDSRQVAASILNPTAPISVESANSGVVSAMSEALKTKPEMIVCAADFGYPVPGSEVRMESYFCTRWGLALSGASKGGEWRLVPLNAMPVETLISVRENTKDEEVVLLRLVDPATPMLKEDTWWWQYTNKNWRIIQVR